MRTLVGRKKKLRSLLTNQRTLKFPLPFQHIVFKVLFRLKTVLCGKLSTAGAININFLSKLEGFSEHNDFIVVDFHEPRRDGCNFLVTTFALKHQNTCVHSAEHT